MRGRDQVATQSAGEVADETRFEVDLRLRHLVIFARNPRLDQPLPTQWFATTDVLRRMQIYLEFQRQRIGDALERRDAEVAGRIFQRRGLLSRHAEPLAELRL